MIYEASIGGVFRIILWIIVISLLIRFIARLTAPIIIRKVQDEMKQKMNEHFESRQPKRSEGDVSINSSSSHSHIKKNHEGEYVDYVEIKD